VRSHTQNQYILSLTAHSAHLSVLFQNQKTAYLSLSQWSCDSTTQREVGVCFRLTAIFLCIQLTPTAVDLLLSAAGSSTSTTPQPVTDLEILEQSIQTVSGMLDRVLTYVRSVLAGEIKGDPAVGRYLMDTLGASTSELEKSSFNTSLQARLICVHLILQVTDILILGHNDGLIPRKPRSLPGRGIVSTGSRELIVLAIQYPL
jgi:hypothetical protein